MERILELLDIGSYQELADREDCATFLLSPAVCSLETLHIQQSFRILPFFGDHGAKDLLVQAYDEPTVVEWEALVWFVLTRIVAWLEERVEIDKIHLLVGGDESCPEEAEVMTQITNQIARLVLRRPDRGWIDRTYEGLNLVLRTSDGQALVFYWDAADSSLLLLRSEYNFRRGRCFGSFERNAKALAEIRELMRDWQIQIKQNPVRVAETKEKLKLECAKFNDYNRGATTQDLLIDAIWRSTSQRRSPWARCGENNTILRSATYPDQRSIRFTVSTDPEETQTSMLELEQVYNSYGLAMYPPLPFKLPRPAVVIERLYGIHKLTYTDVTIFLRMFLANSTVQEVRYPLWWFGNRFWLSLNMKMTHICVSTAQIDVPELLEFIDHFRPTSFYTNDLFEDSDGYPVPELGRGFLSDPLVCSLEKLHIYSYSGDLCWLYPLRARDIVMGLTDRRYTTKLGQQPIFDFLSRKIRNWLSGTEEIDKIHLCTDLRLFAKDSIEFRPFFKALPFLISSKVGWVDQTYDGMPLILRASDGQALLMFFASGDRSIYLIRCEYNFRRGRCLGSFERNEKALQKIRGLMSIASRLSSQNPELAKDAKEKLREECIKFNKYNEGATELDLLTDSIWRSKGSGIRLGRRAIRLAMGSLGMSHIRWISPSAIADGDIRKEQDYSVNVLSFRHAILLHFPHQIIDDGELNILYQAFTADIQDQKAEYPYVFVEVWKRIAPRVEKRRMLIVDRDLDNIINSDMFNRRHRTSDDAKEKKQTMKPRIVCISVCLYILSTLSSTVSSNDGGKRALNTLAELIVDNFNNHSHANVLQKGVEEVEPRLRIRSESAESSLISATSRLTKLFADRKAALLRIVKAANATLQFYKEPLLTPINIGTQDNPNSTCASQLAAMQIRDVHFHNPLTDYNRSGVHLNVESYVCDGAVIRDYEWTKTAKIEETFEENRNDWPDIGYQYIGTYTGLTRMFPSRPWILDPPSITVDLFDPRFRPWFTQAESIPKDVVFLIDFSGSMKGPTMHLAKVTIMYIMSTLTPNDYFYGVSFQDSFRPILPCSNISFLPATTANKKIFYETLATIEEKEQANLGPPLNFTLEKLREYIRTESPISTRSGGHKLAMFFTDGIDEFPERVVDEQVHNFKGEPVRIYGYAVGFGTGPLESLHRLACLTNASSAVVDSISDVKAQGRAHLDHLSRQKGRRMQQQKLKPTVTWSSLYQDAQGIGPVISVSSPIAAGPADIWRGHTMAGIAAIDIHISEITSKLPTGEQLYAFVVDNNGILIYHPQLLIPKTEVHAVRRSACYDAASVKSKAGAGLKVQYGLSDERVFRLVGLIDSISTVDMLDLEERTVASEELRNRIIDQKCDEKPIQDGLVEYYCAEIKGSPFTLIIVNHHERQSITVSPTDENEEGKEFDQPTLEHNMVSTIITNRELCQWSLDAIAPKERPGHILSHPKCGDDPQRDTVRAMLDLLAPWIDSWPESLGNVSCPEVPFPSTIPSRYFVVSFAHTRARATSYYPQCAIETMKVVTKRLDKQGYTKKNSTELEFSLLGTDLMVTKSFADKYGNRIGTAGVVWRRDFVEKIFANWTAANAKLWKDFKSLVKQKHVSEYVYTEVRYSPSAGKPPV
ncbi:unnamed protein product, partial [Mesorhabditis spiculigera]